MKGRLAYLFPAFPVFHQTFVLWEVLGIQRAGLQPRIYSLRRGTDKQQDEGRAIVPQVTYLPGLRSGAVWGANLRALLRSPLRYLGLYVLVAQAWRTGSDGTAALEGFERRPLKFRDRVRGWYNTQPLLYLLKSWAVVPNAIELAERLRADGITHLHVHWATYPATMALVIQRFTGLPFSISAHAYDIYMITRMLPAKIAAARWVFTCAKTNAAFLRRLAAPADADKIIVNYHGVNTQRFTPPAVRPVHAALRVVSCGQLERYKGMHLLVEACGTLHSEGIPVECWIVGEGPYRTHLEQQIAGLGMSDRIHLTGAQPHSEVARLLAEADVFALASELGGTPGRRDVIANVIVEAMAAGLPAIASRIPGAAELIDDGESGFLVRPNRADEVAQVLRRLAGDADLRQRVGIAARAKIVRDFDNHKNVQEMAAMLGAAAAQS